LKPLRIDLNRLLFCRILQGGGIKIENLLGLLKNELFITWEDIETDKRLSRIIENAIPTMNFKIGANIDYEVAGQEQNLFLIYCAYVYNNCVKDFDINYQPELNQLRIFYEVRENEE